jgi:hypothetical protein
MMSLVSILKRSLIALRILQVCSALAIVIMFAYLTGLIAVNRLGLTSRMIAIETMVLTHPFTVVPKGTILTFV